MHATCPDGLPFQVKNLRSCLHLSLKLMALLLYTQSYLQSESGLLLNLSSPHLLDEMTIAARKKSVVDEQIIYRD